MSVHLDYSVARRKVLRQVIAAGVGIPLLGATVAMLRRVQSRQVPLVVHLPADLPSGFSVVESVVVQHDQNGTLHAFSGHCTHLGCRLDRITGDEAVCPCHGSRFRADGSVAAGPATRPLAPLKLEQDGTSGGWIARASS
jgi:Rieske Fe-S protein